GQACRRGRARSLGNRKPTALGARRRLRRGPIPPAQRSRREKHGHRPAFGGQSRPHRPGTRAAAPHETATQSHQAKTHEHRAAKKNRKLEKRLSHHRIQRIRPLTRIRSPVALWPQRAIGYPGRRAVQGGPMRILTALVFLALLSPAAAAPFKTKAPYALLIDATSG